MGGRRGGDPRNPAAFQRPDGTSRFRPRGSETYTTQALLDAEARLLDAGRPLSADQSAAVQQIVVSGRVVDVLVVGLAPSAAAAEVLADVVGIATENTAKWQSEAGRNMLRLAEIDKLQAELYRASPCLRTRTLLHRVRTVAAEVERWALRPGQLVIVDEASMAGTFELDALTAQARDAGAKGLLVGDWAQLSPVAADAYTEHGRVQGGDRGSMLDLLYEAWQVDIRARADRVAIGEVNPSGVQTVNGSVVGVGDSVVTRRNQRGGRRRTARV